MDVRDSRVQQLAAAVERCADAVTFKEKFIFLSDTFEDSLVPSERPNT
jgi:hypothetical protein